MVGKKNQKRTFNGMSYGEVQRVNSKNRSQLNKENQKWLKDNGYKNVGWEQVIKLYQRIEELLDKLRFENMSLEELFLEADRVGNKYLTSKEIQEFNQQLSKEVTEIGELIDQQFPDTEFEVVDYSKKIIKKSQKKKKSKDVPNSKPLVRNIVDLKEKELQELFKLADKVGKQRYHKLTRQDFEEYKKFNNWRYVNGDSECGTTKESQDWVRDNSDWHCPICGDKFSECGGRTIDHKLPRSQYPWLSMEFNNFWVICRTCNQEKGEKHWFEYEHYMFIRHPDFLSAIQAARPAQLLNCLKA